MSIGYFFDCHNTLINSNEAWVKAFVEYVGIEYEDEITKKLYGKNKRREIAKNYNIKFEVIEEAANKYMCRNDVLIKILYDLKKQGNLLFVVSNAPRKRVIADLQNVNIKNLFEKIYTGDDGGKQNNDIFNMVLEYYKLDYGFFVGNEEYEDDISHQRIISVALTSFLKKRNDILKDYVGLDKNGKIVEK